LIIPKGKEQQATWCQESISPKGWRIANNPNGWTTDIIGLRWLKKVLEPCSKQHSTGAKRLLILDGHSSHLTADFDTFCKENAISALHALHLIFFNH